MACIAVAVRVSRGVSSWLAEVLPRVFVCLVLCVICGAFKIMVVLSTPHRVSIAELAAKGLSCQAMLDDNDAYHALQAVNGLIITGPTGTNVNDIAIALLG